MNNSGFSKIEKISFMSDGYVLKGVLHLPKKRKPPIVIGSHGLFSNKESPKQVELAIACNKNGIGFFRFDHRGCGESDGDFNEVTSLEARCRDFEAAVTMIRERDDIGKRIGFFGSSFGGSVSISVAGDFDVRAIVTVAAPIRSSSIIDAAEKENKTDYVEKSANKERLLFDISEKASNVKGILIFHGDKDETVPLSHAREIYDKAQEQKRLIIQKNGDHRMSDPMHQEGFIRDSVEWFIKIFTAESE